MRQKKQQQRMVFWKMSPGGADSDLQRRAHGDDLVAVCSVNLQQHRDRLLQHGAADVVETATRFVYSHFGDLTVSRGNCRFRDTVDKCSHQQVDIQEVLPSTLPIVTSHQRHVSLCTVDVILLYVLFLSFFVI